MRLSKAQKQWLNDLESGEYEQCHNRLTDGTGYCCLGVGALVAIEHGAKIKVSDRKFNNTETVMPRAGVETLRLHSREGRIRLEKIKSEKKRAVAKESLGPMLCENPTLTDLNDLLCWSFKEIAAFIRKYPEAVFENE